MARLTAVTSGPATLPVVPGDRLLLVEDDRELAELLVRFLDGQGYVVTVAPDLARGKHELNTGLYPLAIVDRGLPGGDGLRLVAPFDDPVTDTAFLVLSARSDVRDRVTGIHAGAADYLTKPFDLGELAARLQALRRRYSPALEQRRFELGEFVVDVATGVVTHCVSGDQITTLTDAETRLLAIFAERPRHAFTRRELKRRVFENAGTDSVVDTYVHYCRSKLGTGIIDTVRGVGYRAGSG